jgi:NAD(P)-dependent dehydrogenase (short-subunit alcohol dehydrogenase family)
MRSELEAIEMVALTPSRPRRVALVTGSSRGLGSAIARRLASDGLAVAVNDVRGGTPALDVVDAIRDDGGVAHAFTADVTDERQVAGLVDAVADTLGPVDVLVLNATGPQPEAPRHSRGRGVGPAVGVAGLSRVGRAGSRHARVARRRGHWLR